MILWGKNLYFLQKIPNSDFGIICKRVLLGVHWGYFMAKGKSALPAENTYTKKEAGMFLTGMFGQNMIYNIVATGLYRCGHGDDGGCFASV